MLASPKYMASTRLSSLSEPTNIGDRWANGEREAILIETNRILADPVFCGSKRCQALLRYLVEHTVNGEHDGMKERTLGIEVFGRDPNYDTNIDPVVRTTANEIRKRLAQAYEHAERNSGVRIRLDAGSYQPKFEFPRPVPTSEADTRPLAGHLPAAEAKPAKADIAKSSWAWALPALGPWWTWAGVAILAGGLIFLAVRYFESTHSKDYLVWKPLLSSGKPLTLCSSDNVVDRTSDPAAATDLSNTATAGVATHDPNTSMTDAEDAQKITAWLTAHGALSNLRGSSTVNLRDIRQAPAVLIGAFNPWSQTMFSLLRFSAHSDRTTHEEWIQDARNPSSREWKINRDHTDVDYAIITRFFDQETDSWILGLGGLRPYGTQAAADLLTDPSFIRLLPDDLEAKGNFQIVLKTKIIDGSAGRPQVVAFYSW
jgi:hypothetical protein